MTAPTVPRGRRSALTFSTAFSSAMLPLALVCCGGGGGGGSDSNGVSAPSSAPSPSSGSTTGTASGTASGTANVPIAAARNLPANATWVVYYGTASNVDVARVASTFDVIVIDADPGSGSPQFTPAQIATLRSHGAKVLSYLNFGACETWRTYWSSVPTGFKSCSANSAAQLGKMSGYPEYWMNVGNSDYQHLLVGYVAPRMMATGVDGLMLDNFEIVGHGANASDGPCDATCAQGGLDLVGQLRAAYPNAPIVLNHAPVSAIAGTSAGVSFPMLVDGDFGEQVFSPTVDGGQVQQLQSWKSVEATLPRQAFFVGSLDYVGDCTKTSAAQSDWTASLAAGIRPAVATAALNEVCWWSFLPN
jgi:cysteinyl-tRNA synthetase